MNKIWRIITYLVILMYIFLGIFLLVSPRFDHLQQEMKVIFAVILFLYAGWRIARIINRQREKRQDQEDQDQN